MPLRRLLSAFAALLLATAIHAAPRAGEPVLTLEPGTHTAAIRQLAVDANERILVTASDDKTARIWDLANGRLLNTLHVPVGPEDIGRLYAAAVSPEGKLALGGTTAAPGGTQRIYLYDLPSLKFLKAVDARGGDIKSLQWSPDGKLLAAAYAGNAAFRVFDDDGELVHEESLPADAWGLTLSRSGLLALPISNGTVRVYGIAGAVKLLATLRCALPDPRGLQFSPDGTLLAVGYQSRRSAREVQVDVFDVAAQRLSRSIVFNDIEHGNLRNVAWQRDGAALYAAGSGYRGVDDFLVKRIPWPQGAISEMRAAGNSITDLVALTDNRVVFGTVEPGWGVLRNGEVRRYATPIGAQFYDAEVLSISDDARTVAWRFTPRGETVSFALDARGLHPGAGEARRMPHPTGRRLEVHDWRNSYRVVAAGRPVPLAPTEISRAAAVLPDESAVILATSRSLRRIDANGRERWRVPLPTEARAVNVSADGRIAVAAIADGTLRWRRTADGAPLLSLFATRDGRWVLWDEQGNFDASEGAEELIGWTVNQPNGVQADFHPMSRFRDRHFHPRALDGALSAPRGTPSATRAGGASP